MSRINIIRVCLWGLIGLIAIGLSYTVFFAAKPENSATFDLGAPFELVDHNGDVITDAVFDDGPVAMFFGFTHCPEICPTTLYEMSGWMNALGKDGENIKGIFVTVDPARDTPAIMKSYVTNFTDRILGITGPQDEVEAFVRSWRVYFKRQELEDGGYTMDHTASVFLVEPGGKLMGTIAWGEDAATAVEKMRRLAKS